MVNDVAGNGRGEGADITPAQEVADWHAAEGLIAHTVETFGGLDVLVNNAGILRERMSFNMTEEDFDVVVDVVLKGTFAPSHFAASYWREQSKASGAPVEASIVNSSSEAGLYGNAGQANYGSAKMAVAALAIIVARELERTGVRVNAIAPGAATRLLATVRAPQENPDAADPVSPRHIAPLVAWLSSSLAGAVPAEVLLAARRPTGTRA